MTRSSTDPQPAPIVPPSVDDLIDLAEAALATIPEDLSRMVEGVAIQVVDFPDPATCRDMELDSPFDLLGLYSGIPFGEKSSAHTPEDIDIIFLYRRPILDYWCDTGEDLAHVVRHVLIHEIGHHFGFSDAAMEALEAAADAAGGSD